MKACLATAVSHARIAVQDPASCADFATRILGLQKSDQAEAATFHAGAGPGSAADLGSDDRRFRTDSRYQTVIFTGAAGSQTAVGIELIDDRALEMLASRLEGAGCRQRRASPAECKRLAVRAALITHDPSGNAFEFVVGPRISGARFFPARDAGIVGFQGLGLRSLNIERDLRFWTEIVGARVSDRVGDIVFLAIDSYHHRIALYPSHRGGLLNLEIEIESLDGIMQASYFLAERQIRIVQGPGKDAASDQVFLHVAGPDGLVVSLVSGMSRGAAVRPRARQFASARTALCTWGSVCTDVAEFAPERAELSQGHRS